MTTNSCCCRQSERVNPPRTFGQRVSRGFAWIVPGTILALMPKCPVCFAAWFAVFTGFGLSISTASYLRISVIATCALILISLVTLMLIQKLERRRPQ